MPQESRIISALRRHRGLTLAGVDAVAWVVALCCATALRLENLTFSSDLTFEHSGAVPVRGVLAIAAVAIVAHLVLATLLRLHQGRTATASVEELFLLGTVVALAGFVATVVNLVWDTVGVPNSATVIAALLTYCLTAWTRGLWRLLTRGRRPVGSTAPRVVVVGAGEGGRQLVSSMLNDPHQHWNPVAFVDDDPYKKHFRFRGVSVRGTIADLADVATQTTASTVIIAVPSAVADVVNRITSEALALGLDVKVLPGVGQLLEGNGISYRSLRDVEPADLLGRHQIETDVESIAAYLTGRRVLVTGAGGSIGSELCRQITRFSPAAVAFLDRDESALHALALSLDGRADLGSEQIVLADLRDADRIDQVFADFRPEIVFHSAALKHVNVLENHAGEALQTNVWGTLNLLEAAERHGVERFVNISTDKAADPVNVLGYSKRVAERLTAERSLHASGTYLSVRFGNVFGTNGSVIKTFSAQIDAGGPVTVTDPNVTRYFMTVHEAVQLVIQAAVIGRDGEALVLDMGEPVRIEEVARRMIEMSQEDVRIVYTGLKPGEKLHEQLFGEDETDVRDVHPLISHIAVPVLGPAACRKLTPTGPNAQVKQALRDLAFVDAPIGSPA